MNKARLIFIVAILLSAIYLYQEYVKPVQNKLIDHQAYTEKAAMMDDLEIKPRNY